MNLKENKKIVRERIGTRDLCPSEAYILVEKSHLKNSC